jgi:hypothetical protein
MELSDQLHSLAALTCGVTNTHLIGGWVGPRASLDRVKDIKMFATARNYTTLLWSFSPQPSF